MATQGLGLVLVFEALALSPPTARLPLNLHHSVLWRGVLFKSSCLIDACAQSLSFPLVMRYTIGLSVSRITFSNYLSIPTSKKGAGFLGGAFLE